MYTHICIAAEDLEKSKAFYDAVLTPLGVQSVGQVNERTCVYATQTGKLLVMKPADGNPATRSNGGTIGFQAPDGAAVDAFHAAGIANGGTDEGAPGNRAAAPGNPYGAYLRDPVGNKICAFAPPAG
jgi:catechol 2,3-dioxygenase-like lactoylglutathione lyase family enzyme